MEQELSAQTGFSYERLDRGANLRGSVDAIAHLKKTAAARVLIFSQGKVYNMHENGATRLFFSLPEAIALTPREEPIFLGMDEQGPLFACALEERPKPPPSQEALTRIYKNTDEFSEKESRETDLRALILRGFVTKEQANYLALAQSLLNWHATHGFCANCGVSTKICEAGWRRDCDACGARHFPRTDPVAVMLPIHGDYCVLGRQPLFTDGLYSTLAGFIEGGETLENAVRREIHEEIGVKTGSVRYLASQPWPFPHTIMFGCFAEIERCDLRIDKEELEDARWFSRQEVEALLNGAGHGIFCPPPLAIAHHLLKVWIKGEA